ncbi:MAG: hypothetical protein ABSG78_09010 [Verrucomicrobiota bacterium]
MVSTRLTPDQIADAETALHRLADKTLVAGKTLVAVVDFFLANYREPLVKIPLVDAFARFIEEKTAANKRPDTIRNLSDRVGRLCKLHAEKLAGDILKSDIEAFINQPGKGLYARVSDRSVLSGFFRWCVKNQFCQTNPAENIEKIKVDEDEPSILPLADVRALVSEAQGYKDGVCLPYVTLGLFCAIRPAELARLTWNSIDLQAHTVTIQGGAAKRRKRRVVDISKNAAALLAPYALRQTPIRGLNWRRDFDAIKRLAGYGGRASGAETLKPWGPDIMRHTGISHHFAFHKHEGKTAEWAGNSPDVIHRHYKGLVTDSEAAAFWKIGTATAGKIIKVTTAQARRAA